MVHLNCSSSSLFWLRSGISIYGRSILSRILWCRWTPAQPTLQLSSVLFQCCRCKVCCRAWVQHKGRQRRLKGFMVHYCHASIIVWTLVHLQALDGNYWTIITQVTTWLQANTASKNTRTIPSSHFDWVDCDASTFMLMLFSFQRSYCTPPAPLESMWDLCFSPLLPGITVHCSVSSQTLHGHNENEALSSCNKTSWLFDYYV